MTGTYWGRYTGSTDISVLRQVGYDMKMGTSLQIGCALLVLGGWTCTARAADATAEGVEFFEKKIRPVLVANCYKCHGTDSKQRGGLVLDNRAGLLQGGDSGPALVPGQPDKSRMILALRYQDERLRMPPKGKLAEEQIADISAWIKMGAPWPVGAAPTTQAAVKGTFDLQERRKHWAWQSLKAMAPPSVKQPAWVKSPIDAFILAGLEAKGLAPAAPADRRTLIRRATYDLIGLPPTPAEIDAFLSDDSPRAFAKVVDRLLASPHYGERWGRHWLDLVRFAETAGHEFDFDMPEAYVYRDYVIRALNADVPYDQFVIEHIAGDLLAQPRRHPAERFNESILGTGFWFLGEAKHSPVDIRADEAERMDNQIDVLAKAFLGLTVSCARCHDHKFDAISTKDYYALTGYLESSRYQRAFIDSPDREQLVVRPLKELHAQCRQAAVRLTAKVVEERADKVPKFLLAGSKIDPKWADRLFQPWTGLANPREVLNPQQFAARRQELVKRWRDQLAGAGGTRSVRFDDFRKSGYRDWTVTGEAFGPAPSQADVILQPDARSPIKQVVAPGVAHSGLVSNPLQGALRSRTFVIDKKRIAYRVAGRQAQINLIIDNFQRIRSPIYGGLTLHVNHGDRPTWLVQDVSMWVGQRAYIEIADDGPGFIAVDQVLFTDDGPPAEGPNRLLIRMLDDPQVTSPEALARKYRDLFLEIVGQWRSDGLASADDGPERVEVLNALLQGDLVAALDSGTPDQPPADRQPLASLLDRFKQMEAGLPPPRRGMAMLDGTPWNERVFLRGNHQTPGDLVPRRFLEAIASSAQPAPPQGSGRLELARRLVDPANPLPARVMVNRIWQHHFGEGIVRSPDNVGVLGELPTHPELLDYLAAEFMANGGRETSPWSMKKMHRLLLLSNTYQMLSQRDSKGDEVDPQNRLLHHMPIRRLEAEIIRDALLAVSGRLDRKQFGPGVLPHLTPHMEGRGRPHSGPLDGNGRRSIYLNVRRNFLTPMFLAFDYPIPFTTMGKRSVSNVPAQALALMNNPFVLQQAELWARRTLAEPGMTPKQRIVNMYVTAFGRPPTDAELDEALAFVDEQGKGYGRPDDPRAWSDLGHVLMNVKEFIFIN